MPSSLQACSVLLQLVETGGCLPIDLLENTLEAVSRGLGSARQLIEAAQGQLRAVQSTAWSQAVLAAADTCLHSEAWHSAWCGDVGAGGKDAYLRTVALARDMLKDGLLPLLVGAAEQQSASSGFCLAVQFKALLDMGGWRVDAAPGISCQLLTCSLAGSTAVTLCLATTHCFADPL